jgi:hypothetical protein
VLFFNASFLGISLSSKPQFFGSFMFANIASLH